MNNRKMLIVIGIVLFLIVGGALYVLSTKNSSGEAPQDDSEQSQDAAVIELKPEDIGLTFTARTDKKAVKFVIGKASDIKAVEYTISYTKKEDGEEIKEGLFDEITSEGESEIDSGYRDLGTCSSGRCRYHTVVSPLELLLKITKNDGKIYEVKETLEL